MIRGFHLLLISFLFVVTLVKGQQPNIVWITSEDNSKHYLKLFDSNGIDTPHIESLAEKGILFTRAFSNAPVCSAARSTLITSIYGPKLASHYHRAEGKIQLPEGYDMFPAYLRKAGYYTTNNSKEDYNIIKSDSVWDDSSKNASWRNRNPEQPFFHVYNIHSTHEGNLHFSIEEIDKQRATSEAANVFVQPDHPQTETFKYTNLVYRDRIKLMDAEVGSVISELSKDGLLESTIIFYFGDHGGVLPNSKGYLKETGLHVPLVIYIPQKYQDLSAFDSGTKAYNYVGFVDLGATVLSLAGIDIPEFMDGKPFLGKHIDYDIVEKYDEAFGYADRFDEKYDMVRSLRKGKYKYIRNFQPFNVDGLMNAYRYRQLAYTEWQDLYDKKKLTRAQSRFFEPKLPEELYDLESDPFETKNLCKELNYLKILKMMRDNMNSRLKSMPDLSFYPEFYLLQNAKANPIEFGQIHKENIECYIDIANLELSDFEDIVPKIEKYLISQDPWERYWALVVCSSFGESAKPITSLVKSISENDPELINRVRSAEYLGIIGYENPGEIMSNALYETENEVEALLILNSIVLMKDFYNKWSINILTENIHETIKNNKLIKERLKYLGYI